MEKDFNYLHILISDFFKKRHTQKGLKLIKDSDITGWEVWLQVEFATFLSEHNSIPEWWREWSIEYDYRKEREKWLLRPDFIIRKKGWRIESYMALEIKQHPDSGACINNMLSDATKVSKARKSALDVRSYWFLGVTERESKASIKEKLLDRADESIITLKEGCLEIRYIPGTQYAYILF